MLYELATGFLPFSKNLTYLELMQNIQESDNLELPEIYDVSKEFRDFLGKCLRK